MKFEHFMYLYSKVITDLQDEITPFLISLWTTDCEDCEPEDIADLEREENYMLNVTTWDEGFPKLYEYDIVADKGDKIKQINKILRSECITFEDICFLKKYFGVKLRSPMTEISEAIVEILDMYFNEDFHENTYEDVIVLSSILRIKPCRAII